jgi:hypothetical protein
MSGLSAKTTSWGGEGLLLFFSGVVMVSSGGSEAESMDESGDGDAARDRGLGGLGDPTSERADERELESLMIATGRSVGVGGGWWVLDGSCLV